MTLAVSAFVGRPYRAPNGCWQLVRQVYAELLGIELPGFEAESAAVGRDGWAALIEQHRHTWQPVEAPVPGDVVLFRVLGAACHVGVVVAPPLFLHALAPGTTARVESWRSLTWKPRLVGFYRHAV